MVSNHSLINVLINLYNIVGITRHPWHPALDMLVLKLVFHLTKFVILTTHTYHFPILHCFSVEAIPEKNYKLFYLKKVDNNGNFIYFCLLSRGYFVSKAIEE